jgi:hypothetical protein
VAGIGDGEYFGGEAGSGEASSAHSPPR